MLCFLNNLYVSLNVNMKKTQFKLILNSNSYRIYTDNGIEYCRFKKKYYPLDEMENVINSYKTGGAKMFLIIPVLFIVIITKIIKDKSEKPTTPHFNFKKVSKALENYTPVNMFETFEILYATIYIILIYSPKINRDIRKLKSNDFDASLSSNNSTLYNNLSEALSIGRTIYYNNKSLNNPEPGTRMNNTFGGESDVKAVIAKIETIIPKILKEVNSTITIQSHIPTILTTMQSSYIPTDLKIYYANCINVTTLGQIVKTYITCIGPLIETLNILDTFKKGTYINNDIRTILVLLADTIDIYNSIMKNNNFNTLYHNFIETHLYNYNAIIQEPSYSEGLMLLNEDLKTNNITDILSGISPDTVQRIDQLKTNFKKLVEFVMLYTVEGLPQPTETMPTVGELCQAMKKIGVEELNDTPENILFPKYIYMRKMANVFFKNFDEIFLKIIYLITAEIPLPQKLKATTDAEISQTEVIEPPLPQKLKATTDAEISQTEVIEPPLPQIIEATTDAEISQTEVIEPPLPQIFKATGPIVDINQKEVIEPPLPQIFKATGPIVDINQKVEDITPDKQTTIELDRRIKLATLIKKLLEDNNIPIIYTYYFYVKYTDDTTHTDDTTKNLIQIIKKHENYKDKYTDICDAVNKLMIYLTGTAKKIQIEYYTNKELCEEYTIYFETLVFTYKILNGINTDNDTNKKELTKKYIIALNKELPTLFENIKDNATYKDKELLEIQGGDNNYKTAIDNIFNYTESSDESDILYDSDISEESIISIRSDYSEDLITPLLTPQT